MTDKQNKQNKELKRKPKKISDTGYVRPPLTYTDKLTKEQIETILLDYEKVDDITKVPIGTHIRYFEDKEGELKFRVGGILAVMGAPDYIILKNNNVGWSVQIKRCIFFRRLTIKETKAEYDKIIAEKDKTINELNVYIRELEKDKLKLKKELVTKFNNK